MDKDNNSGFFKEMIPAIIMIVAAFLIIVILALCGVGMKKTDDGSSVDISGIWISVIENTQNDDGSAGLNSVRTYSKYFTWTSDGDNGYYATKRIQLQNVEATGSTSGYVRAAIIPSWSVSSDDESGTLDNESLAEYGLSSLGELTDLVFVDDDGNEAASWREASAYRMGDVTFELSDGWVDGWVYNDKDGYFYYKAIVDPGMATTTLLLESVQISDEIYDIMRESGIELQVEVLADAVSTQSGALEEAWGTAAELGIIIRSDGTIGVY
ncbi:MAG: hypothetical protein LIO37_03045 [Clostridiales bacterium]|nr:hypothetical protein [Clostridiales bacterium]